MGRTRVKICGITNKADAQCAVSMGADAIGFNLFEASQRYVPVSDLASFFPDLPPFVQRVGLFVDESKDRVEETLARLQFDLLQFHGNESREYCESFGVPYIKALKATSSEAIINAAAGYPGAAAVLLDTEDKGQFGGTGTSFDWNIVPLLDRPVILAGGLTAENVCEAISRVRPFAVDVSGGVEKGKGQKDGKKIEAFIQAVNRADRELA